MSHSKPSTTTFQQSYLKEFPWVKEHPTFKNMAVCVWCNKNINIGGMGRTALNSHTKSKKHISINKTKEKNLPLFYTKAHDDPLPGPSNSQVPSLPTTAVVVESEVIKPIQTPVSSTRPQTAMKQYLLSENVIKSEIFWCLQSVINHISFRAAARCASSFSNQFPDSEIASKIKLERTKLGYVVVFGLAPYFQKQFEKKTRRQFEHSCEF